MVASGLPGLLSSCQIKKHYVCVETTIIINEHVDMGMSDNMTAVHNYQPTSMAVTMNE